MDNLIYYNVIKYIDKYNISKLYNINIFNSSLELLIKIHKDNELIKNNEIIRKYKEYYNKKVIREYNLIFLSNSSKILQSRMSIKNIINHYPLFYQIKKINKEISEKFYKNGREKILQSRLSIKDIIKKPENPFEPFLLKYYFRDIDYLCSTNLIQLFQK
jgi:hypothetical protein